MLFIVCGSRYTDEGGCLGETYRRNTNSLFFLDAIFKRVCSSFLLDFVALALVRIALNGK